MREIRFRAFHKKLKIMSDPWGLFEGFDGRCMYNCYVNGEQYLWYPDEVELMQYTDLKDKNGKEIYEGDILKRDDEEWQDEVVFENGCFKFKGDEPLEFYLDVLDEIEVIGNIYEHPSLVQNLSQAKDE